MSKYGLAAILVLTGSYRSHERTSTLDGGADVNVDAPVDALPLRCSQLTVAESVALDDANQSTVTPRVVALPGGDVGVVYVGSDGAPTTVAAAWRSSPPRSSSRSV